MRWHKLVFRQNQPLHIGSLRWGVISETEVFIPGWTMWGALTNEYLIKQGFREIEAAAGYFEIITNFYPFLKPVQGNVDNCSSLPLFPQYKDGVWHLGDGYSENDFRFIFTDIMVGTAVEPVSRTAVDKSLHECEYILPKSKKSACGEEKELYWIGLLGIENEDKTEEFLRQGLKIYVGGERRYGQGELELAAIREADEDELQFWNLNQDATLLAKNDFILANFLEFYPGIMFKGEIILLAEFDFRQALPKIQKAGYYITAGSQVKKDSLPKDGSYRLKKGKFAKQ